MTRTSSNRLPGAPWVWFDLDDTLWDFSGNSPLALTALYHDRNLRKFWPTAQDWLDVYHVVNAELWGLYAAGRIDSPTLRRQRFLRPLLDAGADPDGVEEYADSLDADYLRRLSAMPTAVEGAHEALRRLRPYYNIGVLSNGFKDTQYNKLESSGLDDLVDLVVLSDEAGAGKPARRIFDYALERAGGSPEETIMVGDNRDTDIAGALAAGWKAVLFDPSGLTRVHGAPSVRSLAEAADMLLKAQNRP